VVFGGIVGKIELAFDPADLKLVLADTVTDPVEAHVNCFGSFLFDRVVGKARGSTIVGDDRRGGLGVAHFFKANAQCGSFYAIVETTCKLSFSGTSHNFTQNLAP
jgi:hypothetical protein